jgi:hypothetical protein
MAVEHELELSRTADVGSSRQANPTRVNRNWYSRISLVLRRTHMFVALFLTPWIAMYAISTLVFNHNGFFRGLYGGSLERFQKENEVPYARVFDPDASDSDIGNQIRKDLGIKGILNLRESDDDSYVFMQNGHDTFTPRRITYFPAQKKLVIEKQVFLMPNFLTRLHSRVGYGGQSKASAAWAVSVDLSIFASILWIFSGFWMWWELKVTRRWGFFFAFLGPALFALIWWLA